MRLRRHPARAALAGFAFLALAAAARAQAPAGGAVEPAAPAAPESPSSARPLWEIGAGAVLAWQPAYPGSGEHLRSARVLPYGIYRGSVLRVEDGTLGVRALRTPRTEWGLSGSFAFGGGANEVAARAGMPAIGTLVEIGPLLRVNLGPLDGDPADARDTRLDLPLRAVLDADASLAFKGWSFEPRLGHTWWRNGALAFSSSLGVLVGDRRLDDLFYGVAPAYATPGRPAYAARAGLVAWRLGAGLSQAISPTLRLEWFAGLESVQGAANESSPLVRRHQDVGLGLGVFWGLWQSESKSTE